MSEESASLRNLITESDVGRYFLAISTEDRKDVLLVPLALDGSEPYEQAVRRFEDAIVVSRQQFLKRDGYLPAGLGIDGKPRTERDLAVEAMWRKGMQCNWKSEEMVEENEKVYGKIA